MYNNIHVHVCLDTWILRTFLRNTIEIRLIYEKKAADIHFLTIKTCSTISDSRGETTNIMHSDFTVLTYTLHIIVLLGSKIDFHNQKTNKSDITGAHRVNSYHLLLFQSYILESYNPFGTRQCNTSRISIILLTNLVSGHTNSVCVSAKFPHARAMFSWLTSIPHPSMGNCTSCGYEIK